MNYEIYFQAYHHGERWNLQEFPYPLFRTEKIWDDYRDRGLLEEVGVDAPTIGKFYWSRVLLHSNRGVKADPGPYCTILLDAKPPEFMDIEPSDVYQFSFTDIDSVRVEFYNWLKEKIDEGDNTGADDGTFDYYPDIWYIGHQVCHALGMEDEYRRLRQELLDTTQYGRDDDLELASYIADCPVEEHNL